MNVVDLSGSWQVRQGNRPRSLAATVPGCIHLDLLNAGKIKDPFAPGAEARLEWIARETWHYEKTFTVPESLADMPVLRMRCEGLDTLAVLTLNGAEIGRADNMHRVWRYDLRGVLRAGENRLCVTFDPPLEHIERRQMERQLPDWHGTREPAGRAWLRKMACNFGWDWSPSLPTCGIWRPIAIEAFNVAAIEDVRISQQHRDGEVTLTIEPWLENAPTADTALQLKARLLYKGMTLAETSRSVDHTTGPCRMTLDVPNPRLWWPAGLGEQPLYEVWVELTDARQHLLDSRSRRVGLRRLRLERQPDAWGESFRFVVNGVPFFAKGANWIPADVFVPRMSRVEYARLIKAAAMANMNMLRVWGGGIYEQDCFYDLCDEYGLCVWQDFAFACSTYPAFDRDWIENCRLEAEQNVARLRHHACLALWCGNNELEQGLVADEWNDRAMGQTDYTRLFDQVLPRVVADVDPGRDYWPGSPHTPPPGNRREANDDQRGDAHLWQVWHGGASFEWFETSHHRFISECGFQSFPEPRVVADFTPPGERHWNSAAVRHRQRSAIGNDGILRHLSNWFQPPSTFENTLWLSQIQQGVAMKIAAEHWRRLRPRCMGMLYWQLNDCWPAPTWSSLDSHGRWKALHYMARRFYAPVMISGVAHAEDGTVEVFLHNDGRQEFVGVVQWRIMHADGQLLREQGRPVDIPPGAVQRLGVLKMPSLMDSRGNAPDLLVWLSLSSPDGRLVSSNLVTFGRPVTLPLIDPRIRAEVRTWDDANFAVNLTARHPALWCWLEVEGVEAVFEDNFFHLAPERPHRIRVAPSERLRPEDFRRGLRIRSLWDTYNS